MPDQGSRNPQPGSAGTAAKVCKYCGNDCTGKPRTKDSAGRYACATCVENVKSQRNPPPSPPPPAPPLPPESDADEALPFLEERSLPAQEPCPNCKRPIAHGGVLCTACGFNTATGSKVATQVSAPSGPAESLPQGVFVKVGSNCGRCGYDLSKLKTPRCPECGAINRGPNKEDRLKADSRHVVRMAYIKPALIAALGLAVSGAIVASRGSDLIPIWAITFGVSYVLGVIVYFFCTLTFVGVDEPFHLMMLRLLAVYALVAIPSVLLDGIPMGFTLRSGIIGAVHVASLVVLMEIEYEDAWLVALFTMFSRILAMLLLVWAFAE